ncbi:hypothetical protein MNQ96_14885 [Sphingopyxis granuli]|uniref:hypothetical protein n=1 Tax=Sphingopyxis granuli TaxID=267128 RepID=UPI001F53D480|nr:hypothetical protein [Sphingopyxis granuli]UNK78819.1 hypothetical protein MNQ96_14885 [Sphingopyxis granuli]
MGWLTGAIIEGTDFRYLAHGSYGAIFADRQRQRARKIFFKKGSDQRALVAGVCCDEIKAYRIAQNHPEASQLIPEFYGETATMHILDANGQSLNQQFFSDLGYEMELITGEDKKLRDTSQRDRVEKIFHAAGIAYTQDSSIIQSGERIAVIDFGTFDPDPPAALHLPDKNGLWS